MERRVAKRRQLPPAAQLVWLGFLSPRFQLAFNVVAAIVWAGLFWPGLTALRESVPFLVFVSIYANFAGHLSGVAAAVSARKADKTDPL